jgi:hypothetical protein
MRVAAEVISSPKILEYERGTSKQWERGVRDAHVSRQDRWRRSKPLAPRPWTYGQRSKGRAEILPPYACIQYYD